MDGWYIVLIRQLECHSFACLGFESITRIRVTYEITGKVTGSGVRTASVTSSIVSNNDLRIRMDSQELLMTAKYIIPADLLKSSADALRSLSEGVRESVVLWIGTDRVDEAFVQRLLVPRQLASAKHFEVSLEERIRIIRELGNSGEKVLAQLHTHPRRAFHSCTDDRLALPRHTGAISIVVPNFASNWNGDLNRTSVNRHLGNGIWSELSSEAVPKLFEIR